MYLAICKAQSKVPIIFIILKIISILLYGYLYLGCDIDGMKILQGKVDILKNREEKAGLKGTV